jgi:hypothetical protein
MYTVPVAEILFKVCQWKAGLARFPEAIYEDSVSPFNLRSAGEIKGDGRIHQQNRQRWEEIRRRIGTAMKNRGQNDARAPSVQQDDLPNARVSCCMQLA